MTGISRPYVYPISFAECLLSYLGGGAWTMQTHVIILQENQGVRCQNRLTLGFCIKKPNINSVRVRVKK